MYYCRPSKHIFETILDGTQIVDVCTNCRCRKIRHDATRRFRNNTRELGRESACRIAGFPDPDNT